MLREEQERAQFEVVVRRRRVARLFLKGMTQEEAAKELGVDQATVSRDLEALRKQLQWEAAEDVREMRSQELLRLKLIEEEAWEAWERSRDGIAESGDEPGESREGTKREERNRWRYLEIVMKCSNQRRKLMGLDVSPRPMPSPPPKEDMSPEELEQRVNALLESIQYRANAGGATREKERAGGERGGDRNGAGAEREGGKMDHGQWIMENEGEEDEGGRVPPSVAKAAGGGGDGESRSEVRGDGGREWTRDKDACDGRRRSGEERF